MRVLFRLFLMLLLVGAVFTVPKLYTARQMAQVHYAEASQRVEAAVAARKTVLDFSGLTHLRQMPDNAAKIADLHFLNASETELSSLDRIARFPKLEHLRLRDTRIRDLTPLTRLPNLTFLDIGKTLVQDLEPLARVPALERVDIGNTEILSLEPATRIRGLLWINLHHSYAHDGSRQHYDTLFANVPKVYNGSAFKQNYTPHPIYLRKTQANRLADWFYLPQPYPRP